MEPYDNSYWGFEQRWQEEKKKKINTQNSCLPKFAPLVARTSLEPITQGHYHASLPNMAQNQLIIKKYVNPITKADTF